MRSDWQQVKRLLLVSLLDRDSQSVSLKSLVSLVQRNLPQGSITILAAFPDCWSDASPDEQRSTLGAISLPFPFSDLANHAKNLIQILKPRSFDAAILLTQPQQSPYLMAYCCYLAGIPIRVGHSCEFGGGVLSHWVKPPIDPVDPLEYQLYLLQSVGFAIEPFDDFVSPDSTSILFADMAVP